MKHLSRKKNVLLVCYGVCFSLSLGVFGCSGDSRVGSCTVKGTITAMHPRTRKMEPVVGGTITFFHEEKEKTLYFPIKYDGTYEAKGVFAGTNKIAVSSPNPKPKKDDMMDTPDPAPETEETIPKEFQKKWFPVSRKYSSYQNSGITLPAVEGEQPFDIKLKKAWKKGEGPDPGSDPNIPLTP